MTLEKTKEESLALGEITPQNRLQNQIRLATQLFELMNGPVDHVRFQSDLDYRNNIMTFWSDGSSKSYSARYRELEESDWFKNDSRLRGDIFKITPQILLEFIRAKKK
jgi:hypothetical protein